MLGPDAAIGAQGCMPHLACILALPAARHGGLEARAQHHKLCLAVVRRRHLHLELAARQRGRLVIQHQAHDGHGVRTRVLADDVLQAHQARRLGRPHALAPRLSLRGVHRSVREAVRAEMPHPCSMKSMQAELHSKRALARADAKDKSFPLRSKMYSTDTSVNILDRIRMLTVWAL